jgi:hypothetical protein
MGSIKNRSVGYIKMESSFFEISTSLSGFVFSSFVEGNINPATELALFVPNRLSMSDKHNLVSPRLLFFDKGLFFFLNFLLTDEFWRHFIRIGFFDKSW